MRHFSIWLYALNFIPFIFVVPLEKHCVCMKLHSILHLWWVLISWSCVFSSVYVKCMSVLEHSKKTWPSRYSINVTFLDTFLDFSIQSQWHPSRSIYPYHEHTYIILQLSL